MAKWLSGIFLACFKLELGHPECYPILGELVEAIAGQIRYYNNERIHTALKCAPAIFARRHILQQPIVNANIENVYEFIQQKNQQLRRNNQEVTKVLCV